MTTNDTTTITADLTDLVCDLCHTPLTRWYPGTVVDGRTTHSADAGCPPVDPHQYRPTRQGVCDVCGRAPRSHRRPTTPTTPRTITVAVQMTVVVDLDSWDLNYGGWDQSRSDIRGQVIEDARSAVEVDLDARGIKATVR